MEKRIMGYTTKFSGSIQLSRKLTMAEAKQILEANDDPENIPGEKPSRSYMQWVPTEELDHIVWDGGEKFYDYSQWLTWLCNLMKTWGISANGTLGWSGEETGDHGIIEVRDSVVTATPNATKPIGHGAPLTLSALQAMALEQLTS